MTESRHSIHVASLTEKRRVYRDLLRFAHRRGYHPSYASAKYIQTFGEEPDYGFGLHAIYGTHPNTSDMNNYLRMLCFAVNNRSGSLNVSARRGKVRQYFKVEFGMLPEEAGLSITIIRGEVTPETKETTDEAKEERNTGEERDKI